MKTTSEMPPAPAGRPLAGAFLGRPGTRLGRWSAALGAAFVVLFLINAFVFMPGWVEVPGRQVILPFYGIGMLACGLGAGACGLVAVTRQRERSWMVWLTLLPGVWVIFMVLGEFLVPH